MWVCVLLVSKLAVYIYEYGLYVTNIRMTESKDQLGLLSKDTRELEQLVHLKKFQVLIRDSSGAQGCPC